MGFIYDRGRWVSMFVFPTALLIRWSTIFNCDIPWANCVLGHLSPPSRERLTNRVDCNLFRGKIQQFSGRIMEKRLRNRNGTWTVVVNGPRTRQLNLRNSNKRLFRRLIGWTCYVSRWICISEGYF